MTTQDDERRHAEEVAEEIWRAAKFANDIGEFVEQAAPIIQRVRGASMDAGRREALATLQAFAETAIRSLKLVNP